MKLIDILSQAPLDPRDADLRHWKGQDLKLLEQEITSIASDSRAVQKGSIFVALQGGAQDGHRFIQQAIEQGALLVLGEKEESQLSSKDPTVPYISLKSDSRRILGALASGFFGNPSSHLLVIGVTGTSGKTTTSFLIESILTAAGHQVGMIGTVHIRYAAVSMPSALTTPDTIELHRLLAAMKSAGCTAVVMEVSSHALKQKRIAGIAFDAVVYTNLSPEHLDFHPDMEDYYQSKSLLFTECVEFAAFTGKRPVAVINEDDSYGRRLLSELRQSQYQPHFGLLRSYGAPFQSSVQGIHAEVEGVEVRSSLTGQFNCSNIAASVAVSRGLGLSVRQISQGIQTLPGVPGRLERVENHLGIHVWVDYAHKPDALEKVIAALQAVQGDRRLLTVFGCGGDRDRKKRPLMGQIAVQGSDWVYITSDNPRTEDPNSIIQDILVGIQGYHNFNIEPDRRKAIHSAIECAKPGDLVLIAGKGHEDYQILGSKKVHFDDREVAREALFARKS